MPEAPALEWLTPAEAALLLKFAPATLEKWRREGHGPTFLRVGRSVRYPLSALQAWMAAQPESASE